ncbi:hypothetical protein CYMTET_33779, partial [Cymbomonas tetramitiformis]
MSLEDTSLDTERDPQAGVPWARVEEVGERSASLRVDFPLQYDEKYIYVLVRAKDAWAVYETTIRSDQRIVDENMRYGQQFHRSIRNTPFQPLQRQQETMEKLRRDREACQARDSIREAGRKFAEAHSQAFSLQTTGCMTSTQGWMSLTRGEDGEPHWTFEETAWTVAEGAISVCLPSLSPGIRFEALVLRGASGMEKERQYLQFQTRLEQWQL